MSNPVLENIRTRRVIRDMTDEPVDPQALAQILEAGRWSPTGGNQRPNRFVVIDDPQLQHLIRLVSPGMFQHAPILILICVDFEIFHHQLDPLDDPLFNIDVGKAAQTMALAAHSLGLSTGPVTSFNKAAVHKILNLPEQVIPCLFLCVGHKGQQAQFAMRGARRIRWQDLCYRNRYEPWED